MRVKFWLKTALQNSAFILLATLFYVVFMCVMEPIDSMREVFQIAAIYLLMFGAIITVIMDYAAFRSYMSMALGFGSTRKEAVLGRQLYRLVSTVLLASATIVLGALAGEETFVAVDFFAAIVLAVLLLADAIGSVMGALSTRLSKGAMTVVGIVGFLVAVVVIAGSIIASVFLSVKFDLPRAMIWLIPVASAVLYGLSFIPERKAIYNYNVKL